MIYGFEFDDGSLIKRLRYLVVRVLDKGFFCELIFLYGLELDEFFKKKFGLLMVLNELILLYEFNFDEDNDKVVKRLKESLVDVVEKDKVDSLLEERLNIEKETVVVKDIDAIFLYYRVEMSFIDDEGDLGM